MIQIQLFKLWTIKFFFFKYLATKFDRATRPTSLVTRPTFLASLALIASLLRSTLNLWKTFWLHASKSFNFWKKQKTRFSEIKYLVNLTYGSSCKARKGTRIWNKDKIHSNLVIINSVLTLPSFPFPFLHSKFIFTI